MKRMVLILLVALLLIPITVKADKGAGVVARYEIETGMYATGIDGMITAWDKHIRVFGQGVWAEETDGVDKQVSAGAEVIYVPRPENTYDFYISLGADGDYIKTLYDATTYIKGALGAGAVYHFGSKNQNAAYLGYRSKTIGSGEEVHEAALRLIWAF